MHPEMKALEPRPPEIFFEQGFGSETSCMSSGGGVMYGVSDSLSFMWRDILAAFEV